MLSGASARRRAPLLRPYFFHCSHGNSSFKSYTPSATLTLREAGSRSWMKRHYSHTSQTSLVSALANPSTSPKDEPQSQTSLANTSPRAATWSEVTIVKAPRVTFPNEEAQKSWEEQYKALAKSRGRTSDDGLRNFRIERQLADGSRWAHAIEIRHDWILNRVRRSRRNIALGAALKQQKLFRLRQSQGQRTKWAELVRLYRRHFGPNEGILGIDSGNSTNAGNVDTTVEITTHLFAASEGDSTINQLDSRPACFADEVLQPETWTKTNLFYYIRSVIRARPGRLRGIERDHNQNIAADVLLDVLAEDSPARHAFSRRSFEAAFSYLLRSGKRWQARYMLDLMDGAGLRPTATVYNELLLHHADRQNLDHFKTELLDMKRRSISPDAITWLALLVAAPNVRSKQLLSSVSTLLQHKFDRRSARISAPRIISYAFEPYLEHGGDLDDFLDNLDKFYGGAHWMSVSALHCLLRGLGRRGSFVEAVNLLERYAERRGGTILVEDLNTLLSVCARYSLADLAVALTTYILQRREVQLTQLSYGLLLCVAGKSRMYNLSKVIWKYAAFSGLISRNMQQSVFKSLVQRTQPYVPSVNNFWWATFGTVVCHQDLLKQPDGTVVCREDPLKQAELVDTAIHIIRREQAAYVEGTVARPFTDMLAEALLLDKQWKESKVRLEKDVEWMMEHAVHVPFVRNDSVPIFRRVIAVPTEVTALEAKEKVSSDVQTSKEAKRLNELEPSHRQRTLIRRFCPPSNEATSSEETTGVEGSKGSTQGSMAPIPKEGLALSQKAWTRIVARKKP